MALPPPPCADQTLDEVKAYYETAGVGSAAAFRETHGRLLVYRVTTIAAPPDKGRVKIKACPEANFTGTTFTLRRGKPWRHILSQTSLVVPTEAVLWWAQTHPNGSVYYEMSSKW